MCRKAAPLEAARLPRNSTTSKVTASKALLMLMMAIDSPTDAATRQTSARRIPGFFNINALPSMGYPVTVQHFDKSEPENTHVKPK